MARRRGRDIGQRTPEAHESILEHVIRFFPALQARKIAQHPPGQASHLLAGVIEQLVTSSEIALLQALDPGLVWPGLPGTFAHRKASLCIRRVRHAWRRPGLECYRSIPSRSEKHKKTCQILEPLSRPLTLS